VKILVNILPAASGYVAIYDDGNIPAFSIKAAVPTISPEFRPHFHPKVQKDVMFQNPAQYRQPLLNTEVSHELSFIVTYVDLPGALASVRAYAGLLGTLFHMRVEQGAEAQYYPNCIVDEGGYSAQLAGAAVTHTLQLTSDSVQTNPP
jgi:hypothetical protein